MHDVVPGEAQRVDGDEAVAELHRAVAAPHEAGMERERQLTLLQHGVGARVAIVPHALVARRRDAEPDDARLVAQLLDHALAGRRIVEREIEARLDARLGRDDVVDEPAVIGARQRHLDLDARRQSQRQHRRREEAGLIDAERVHPALRQRNVAVDAGGRLFLVPAPVARDAARHLLVRAARRSDAAFAHALDLRLVAHHRVLDIFEDLLERLGLVMVRVDVDDAEILVFPLRRLLGRMGEQGRRVEFFEAMVAEIDGIHAFSTPS